MLIFIFQSIWFFIDELAGKGLDLVIIGKFLFYYMPNLVPSVLPLTVLLASIMTFGNFAENYEFAAMKASGISLQRAMRSLIVFIGFLAIGTFFFANNVIPAAEYKSFNLRRNIAQVKPALAITEGVFNDIGNMNMKVDDKYGNNDNLLKNVIIHKKTQDGRNSTVIKAVDGELISSEKSNILQLVLKDGNYYEDVKASPQRREKYPHAKATFETYTMNVDLRELNDVDLNAERVSNTHKMLNIKELNLAIDSLEVYNTHLISEFSDNISKRTGLQANYKRDTTKTSQGNNKNITTNIVNLYEDWRKQQLIDIALNGISNTVNTIEGKKFEIARQIKILNFHKLAYHDKFSLAFACVVLFFVGAPLGAIIRKGGMGLPMVVAIGLFLAYYFIGIFAKNYAEDGSIPPILGSWISTLIMLPLGILLTKRATEDKMSFDFYKVTQPVIQFFKKYIAPIGNFLKKTYLFLDSL